MTKIIFVRIVEIHNLWLIRSLIVLFYRVNALQLRGFSIKYFAVSLDCLLSQYDYVRHITTVIGKCPLFI